MEYDSFFKAGACCFSGYRPEKLPWGTNEKDPRCIRLKAKIFNTAQKLYQNGIKWFICGMARGADTYFCEEIIRLKDIYPDVTIEAAIPFEGQPARWSKEDRNRYFRLISRCDVETLLAKYYTPDCMHQRNRYMVDNSSYLITVFDGKFGGTMYTRSYAARHGVEIIEIIPEK